MKISVVTATFNAARTVAESLRSAAAQTHPDVEHWVIDGGSTDATLAVVDAHRGRLAGVVSEPDDGLYDALNKGIARATGEVVGLLHADDLYAHPQVLEKVAAAFADPAVDAVYGDLVYVRHDDPSRIVRYWKAGGFDRAVLRRGWMPPHPTFHVRRRLYERFGGFDTRFRIAADYDAMLRLLGAGGIRVVYIPEVLVRMRIGGISNRSLRTILRKSREDLAAARANQVGGVLTILQKNLGKVGQFWRR